MPDERTDATPFNPFLAWADLGLRAAEMTMASSQNINDAVDRAARAVDGAQPEELAAPQLALRRELPAALEQFGHLQRAMLDWATEGWVRWMSALGSFAALPAGVGLARTVAHQDNPLEAVRTSLRASTWGEPAASGRGGAHLRRARVGATGDAQHAMASPETKPRRKPAAKKKGARATARK